MASGIPDRIEADGRTEVRGELVMLRSTFAAYNAEHPDKPLINPRNAAAGTIRAKDPATVKGRDLRFFAFDLYVEDGASADLERALRDLGFDAADMRHCDDAEAAQAVIAEIEATRNDLDYDLDGAVLRLADRGAYAAAGTRSNSPRGALAFKFAAEEKTTVLADVVWDVGKIGKVAPVAVLEPVFVGGTTVTRATLANQEVIRARDVRIGDTVLVRRAGDVIPFVAGVLDAAKRTGDEREIEPPAECPSCGQPLTEQGNSRELYCTNVACPAQTVRRLIHWASRAAADIEAVGPVWIERLNEHKLLERVSDFYALTREQLLEFEGIADVSADRMIESIKATCDVGLRRALIGLAIPMASEATATRLCRAGYKTLEEVADASEEELQEVEDIGPKVAASLHSHLNREATREELKRLRELGVSLDVLDEDLPPRGLLRRAAGGQDGGHHRLDRRPALGREDPAADVPAPVRARRGDDRLVGERQHRPADLRQRRRREQDREGGEARRRGRRPGCDLEAADRRRRGLAHAGAAELEAHQHLGAARRVRADVEVERRLADQRQPEAEPGAVRAAPHAGAAVAHVDAEVALRPPRLDLHRSAPAELAVGVHDRVADRLGDAQLDGGQRVHVGALVGREGPHGRARPVRRVRIPGLERPDGSLEPHIRR